MSYEEELLKQEALECYKKLKDKDFKFNTAQNELKKAIEVLELNPSHIDLLNASEEEKLFIEEAKIKAGIND